MNLGSLCQRHVITVDRHDSLQTAAHRMRDQHVGALVVTDDSPQGRRVVGLVTDRDLALAVLADGGMAPQQSVGLLVDESLVSASEETDLSQGIELMRAAGVRRLLVRDEQGHLAGIVSFDDLIDACASQLGGLADVVRKGIQREALERAEVAAAATTLNLHVPALGTAGWQISGAGMAAN
ncbi:MAG: CBS domain-containing protein [Betaproteobacteria bacterium]